MLWLLLVSFGVGMLIGAVGIGGILLIPALGVFAGLGIHSDQKAGYPWQEASTYNLLNCARYLCRLLWRNTYPDKRSIFQKFVHN